MTGGYRHDALGFAGRLLAAGRIADPGTRREVREWWLERIGPVPHSRRPAVRAAQAMRAVRAARAARRVLLRR